MQTYQIDTSVSEMGIIKLPEMPDLYNKKVKLVIILPDEDSSEIEQRKQAMERLLKRQHTVSSNHLTVEDLDSIRFERLKEKYQLKPISHCF